MALIAHINPSHIPVHDLQPRFFPLQLSSNLLTLTPTQLLPPLQSLKSRHLPSRHGKLDLAFGLPGSARLAIPTQPLRRGRAWPYSGQLATKQFIATTEVILCDGHLGTKEFATIACQPDAATMSHARGTLQVSYLNSFRLRRNSSLCGRFCCCFFGFPVPCYLWPVTYLLCLLTSACLRGF